MYEIIMCSENWFETKSTSFILKTFWEHYITVWVETCSKTVWFLYIEKWLHRERHKLAWFMEWILNWDYRHQITFLYYFSHSVLPHCWLKLFEKLPRLLLNFWKSLLHCIGFFDSLLMNALLLNLIHMELIWVLFLILWFLFIHVYFVNVCMYQTYSDPMNILFIWYK